MSVSPDKSAIQLDSVDIDLLHKAISFQTLFDVLNQFKGSCCYLTLLCSHNSIVRRSSISVKVSQSSPASALIRQHPARRHKPEMTSHIERNVNLEGNQNVVRTP